MNGRKWGSGALRFGAAVRAERTLIAAGSGGSGVVDDVSGQIIQSVRRLVVKQTVHQVRKLRSR